MYSSLLKVLSKFDPAQLWVLINDKGFEPKGVKLGMSRDPGPEDPPNRDMVNYILALMSYKKYINF